MTENLESSHQPHQKDLTVDELTRLFDGDSIRDNTSNTTILNWGKYEALYSMLNVNAKKGISNEYTRLQERRRKYGSNNPVLRKATTFMEFVMDTFQDPMLRVLCVAALVSLALGILTEGIEQGWMQGTSILMAILLIVSVTSINNYLKQQQFSKLNKIAEKKKVNVVRDGLVFNIDVVELLVGDIVKIETGEITSVDGIMTQCHDFTVDESAMTGESISIHKTIPKTYTKEEAANPYIISGSRVLQGTGEMMVLAVGKNSQYGKIRSKLSMQQDATPLQQKLQVLAVNIGHIGTIAAVLTFSVMMIHLILEIAMSDDKASYLNMETVRTIVEYFIVAVSIIVVAVPEGLPLAVTIALAYSVGRMKDENNLVRYLAACETMGGANNICTDKTGTLTKNSMEVLRVYTNNKCYMTQTDEVPELFKERFSKSCCINSNAYPVIDENGKFEMIGSKTECALLQQAYRYGHDYRKVRNAEGLEILKLYPFSSSSKKMAILYSEKNRVTFTMKGAPDTTIDLCESYYNEHGVQKVDEKFRQQLAKALDEFSNDSLRTLLIAEKEFRLLKNDDDLGKVETGLVFIGLVGIRDPLRPEIIESVKKCKTAGITVRMLTGDNEQTAIAIAKQAGILDHAWSRDQPGQQYAVMQGKDFRKFVEGIVIDENNKQIVKNLDNFKLIQQQLRVLARSSPQDKYLMATGLKQLDDVVAMTGDGTNDAPALKKADIGFAMGITGTEVAKDAAGIILLDDNFASIVTAIKWGRNIIECIRKFLQFQLTVNAVALFLSFVGSAITKESPLNPIQMLWVNLIMDTFASLALATEAPSEDLLLRQPYSRFESLITPVMWKNIVFQAGFQIIILGIILFLGPSLLNIPSSIGVKHHEWTVQSGKHYSIFFNVFVLLQLFNEINSRKLKNQQINVFKGFFSNKLFILILGLTFMIQFLLITYGGKSIRVTPLTFSEHVLCLALGSLSLVFGFISKKFGPKGMNVKLFVDVPDKSKTD